ncbi:AAA family ATPase [Ramlibacter rhizophilus]|uniref:Aminoglycoside phosphotransferase n=1 Tax=Ramlibacter rhizophilus TaxID=1781167 RepID=A0A4Z0BJI7_9BURK|nr:bifunctional aminoglycoside phosphotransferase/ATP-binding protein [Ramlibacter rhizophilus]TFY98589.1 hypothetical protein EZ242_13730 [Ramlibacter rhizophilus]
MKLPSDNAAGSAGAERPARYLRRTPRGGSVRTDSPALRRQAELVRGLAAQVGADIVETHISWVLLAGEDAWKIKKALRLPFLDFSTPALRRYYCEEECRLNDRFAPGLYLGVAAVTGRWPGRLGAGDARQATVQAVPATQWWQLLRSGADVGDAHAALDPQIQGEPLDWAVHMRRFPDSALVSHRLQAGLLRPEEVDAIADRLAHWHAQASRERPDPDHGSPRQRRRLGLAAVRGAAALAPQDESHALLRWVRDESEALSSAWAARQAGGCVCECHGDLHLDNLLWLPHQGAAAFDAVEFAPALRWIDVADDLAFPVMDLAARGRPDLAFRLLVRWLDRSGDHDALRVLRFSLVYRALVRAQVAVLRGDREVAQRYRDGALAWRRGATPKLTLMHGLPGSGKTQLSQQLLEQQGAIRLRSDVERKRLLGLGMFEDSSALHMSVYGPAAGVRTYEVLMQKARTALQAGWPVIIDAAFLRRAERDAAHAMARDLGVDFAIVACEAPHEVLRERVAGRRGDASEADVEALDKLTAAREPLHEEEQAWVTRVWTG